MKPWWRGQAWFWLPVFLVAWAANCWLPDTHPWKGRKESLELWRQRGTELSFCFALLLWWSGFLLLACLASILLRH